MQITKTTDYDLFKRVKGNRPVDINHIKSLMVSVAQRNLLENIPLIVNDKMEVIDGQHRLEVSRAMNLPVYFITVPGGSIEDIRRLNSYSRPWSVADYLESYIDLGLKDYITLKNFAKKFGFSVSMALLILSNTGKNGHDKLHQSAMMAFKKGQFSIEDIERGNQLAKNLTQLKPYLEANVFEDREFVEALIIAYDTVSQLELVERFQEYPGKIQKRAARRDYLRQLEDVVNAGTRRNVRLG